MKKLILLLLLAGAGYAAWYFRPPPPEAAGPGGRGSRGSNPADMPPVPVVEGRVERRDIPLYLDGLGNVQGYNTVTVRSRVDGQLDKILFTEGQDVKAGDVLVQLDPKPFQAALEQTQAKKKQDEAQLENAKLDLERNITLLAQKAVPQQKVDTQKALVSQLEATVKADQAGVDSAQVQLNYATIVSPIGGRAGLKLVDQGNVVHAGDANGLVVISQLQPIYVVFTLPERHLPAIQREMAKGKLVVLAQGRDNEEQLGEGELTVVDNQIDITTGTIKLKATFPNDNKQLWPGQFINARLRLTTRKAGIVVPASVVQRGPDKTYAFVIKDDQSVEIRPIKVEQFEDGLALIQEGLNEGERVVVDGQYRLQPGSRVKTAGGKPNEAVAANSDAKEHHGKPGESGKAKAADEGKTKAAQ
ncbi:MAG: efflux transporter periplasmic adaptor subunit [Verrucomicrobiaceae bacterium]|nr:efflux transporter periplasmic adaptor subunit [Verrucomicrobiaceae bacterium]